MSNCITRSASVATCMLQCHYYLCIATGKLCDLTLLIGEYRLLGSLCHSILFPQTNSGLNNNIDSLHNIVESKKNFKLVCLGFLEIIIEPLPITLCYLTVHFTYNLNSLTQPKMCVLKFPLLFACLYRLAMPTASNVTVLFAKCVWVHCSICTVINQCVTEN